MMRSPSWKTRETSPDADLADVAREVFGLRPAGTVCYQEAASGSVREIPAQGVNGGCAQGHLAVTER
jgi:hypothetical protein